MITKINACRPAFGILTPAAKEKAKNWAGENPNKEVIIEETDALPNITVDYVDGLYILTLHNDKEKKEDSGACRFFDYASMRAKEAQEAYNDIIKRRLSIAHYFDADENLT